MRQSLRPLGRSSLQVAPLAFGGNVFGWSADEATSFALLDAFVETGFDLVDTADSYSYWVPGNQGGESETILGRWFKRSGKRDRVTVATKLGKWERHRGLSPGNIQAAVEGSLQRLQTDVIDLYQAHADDPDTPLVETLGAFSRLIDQGKVRVIGASNYSAARLAQALDTAERHGLPRYECLQPEYNLHDRAGYESELEPLVLAHGIAVIPYYSLASGFLSGKYRSAADIGKSAARAGAIGKYLNPKGLRILQALDDVAASHGATPAQVALAWLMARPSITAPIASATSVAQLHELLAAARLSLTPAQIAQLDGASAE
ncbi:aldo/keto reductase [Lysobacter arenosi]|jgi:aryl-alcohol dehydrogenase-like predicted oxidoreductase|uniref:Aldo/keto reductase n=1 Tax=Lysobacter arenosi TaxID=2795387 RepID=A0ABX7RA74_9GAMM|nr:aldo/keto reductase [Lysobacter arenosi]QSX74311.1 aldo/keto reductase [Lysobacter arenosi]